MSSGICDKSVVTGRCYPCLFPDDADWYTGNGESVSGSYTGFGKRYYYYYYLDANNAPAYRRQMMKMIQVGLLMVTGTGTLLMTWGVSQCDYSTWSIIFLSLGGGCCLSSVCCGIRYYLCKCEKKDGESQPLKI